MPVFRLTAEQASVFAATTCSPDTAKDLQLPFPVFGVLLDQHITDRFDTFCILADKKFAAQQQQTCAKIAGLPTIEVPDPPMLELFFARQDAVLGNTVKSVAELVDTEAVATKHEKIMKAECREHGISCREYLRTGGHTAATYPASLPVDDPMRQLYEDDLCATNEDRNYSELLGRLITGLVLALDKSGTAKAESVFDRKRHKRNTNDILSGCTEYRYTQMLTIPGLLETVRSAVRQTLGIRSLANIRTLVCGHWKMQAHGTGRKDRKHLHIEPYWRGPEDAPIALRCGQLDK
jgi:hypothetical protein